MIADPAVWIVGGTILGACMGFFACALMVSRAIERTRHQSWRAGFYCGRREAFTKEKAP